MRNKTNAAIRHFMVDLVRTHGQMLSKRLVEDTKRAFPGVSAKQIAGNLSAVCCYFYDLYYDTGIVS